MAAATESIENMVDVLFFEDLLRRSPNFTKQDHVLQSIELEEMEGQGFSSKAIRAKLRWTTLTADHTREHGLPEAVVLKIFGNYFPSNNNDIGAAFSKLMSSGHDVECMVYTMNDLRAHVPLARSFGHTLVDESVRGSLILEDMSDRGALLPKIQLFGPGFNGDQIESFLQVITSLHAWSLNTDCDWCRCVPELAIDTPMVAVSSMSEVVLQLASQVFPDVFGNVDMERIRDLVCPQRCLEICEENRKVAAMPKVLVHGDVQPTNILFGKLHDGVSSEIVALLDWQFAFQGCGAYDLALFFFWCVSTEVKKNSWEVIIERYVQLFNEKLHDKRHSISIANMKDAVEELYCYYAIKLGASIVVMVEGMMASRMNGATAEECATMKGHLVEKFISNFKDGVAIYEKIYNDKILTACA